VAAVKGLVPESVLLRKKCLQSIMNLRPLLLLFSLLLFLLANKFLFCFIKKKIKRCFFVVADSF